MVVASFLLSMCAQRVRESVPGGVMHAECCFNLLLHAGWLSEIRYVRGSACLPHLLYSPACTLSLRESVISLELHARHCLSAFLHAIKPQKRISIGGTACRMTRFSSLACRQSKTQRIHAVTLHASRRIFLLLHASTSSQSNNTYPQPHNATSSIRKNECG